MIRKITFIFLAFWLLQSCGSLKKSTPATGEVEDQTLRVFKDAYQNAMSDFDFLQIRSKLEANLDGKTNRATLRLYFEGDERIWANASILGITGARANITQDKVQAYEVLDKTYIDSDFTFFNQKLKVNFINFDRLKSLLLGRLFLIDAWNAYQLETTDDNLYKLSYGLNDELAQNPVEGKYIHTFYLDSNYRLSKVEILDPVSQTHIEVSYKNWVKAENKDLPGQVKIMVKAKDNDKIELEYNNFDFSETNPPFRIPNGYSPREIN